MSFATSMNAAIARGRSDKSSPAVGSVHLFAEPETAARLPDRTPVMAGSLSTEPT